MRLTNTSAYSKLKLAEPGGQKAVPNEVQILRVGSFNHPQYGKFDISKQTLSDMKANFDNRVRGIDMSFDYYHESDKDAAAWPQELELREGGTQLWAKNVEWTEPARQKLSDRALRYFSPDFAFQWTDPETGKTYPNVLFGGGLTNRPFVKEMAPIVAHEKQGVKMATELEQAIEQIKTLSETVKKQGDAIAAMKPAGDQGGNAGAGKGAPPPGDGDEMANLKKQLSDAQAQLAQMKGDNEKLLADKAAAEQAKCMAEKEQQFQVMLTENKACAAQKDAFMKGDMTAFIKLAQPLNPNGGGSSEGNGGGSDEEKVLKLAEEKRKADPKLSVGDSISLANKEIKKGK